MEIEKIIIILFAIVGLLIATDSDADLSKINRQVNHSIEYQVIEGWDAVDGRGDCKVYAKAKFLLLEAAGYEPRLVYGRMGKVAHVTVKVNSLYLDNNHDRPQRRLRKFEPLYEFDRSGLFIGGMLASDSTRLIMEAGL